MINVFTAPYLFDGEKIIEDGAIAFNGKILFVGNKENVLSHLNVAEYQLRNYANGFIMPGLVNSHLHFEVRQVYGTLQKNLTLTDADEAFRAARSALVCLRDGVTAARDMGHRNNVQWDLKKAVDNGTVMGPKIRASRGAIVMNYGHGHLSGWNVKSLNEALANIRQQASEGADFIKILVSHDDLPNVKDPDLCVPWWELDQLKAMSDLAHRCGIKITGHICGRRAIQMAIDAGFDGIEHGGCMTEEEAIQIADKGIVVCPTLTAYKQNADTRWNRGEFFHARSKESWKRQHESVKFAVKHKCRIVTGTDNQGNLAEECQLLREAGMDSLDVLKCVTKNGAQYLEFYDTGELNEGLCADIAVVEGNPIKNMLDLGNVITVVKDGYTLDSDTIRNLIPASPLFKDDPYRDNSL